MEDEEKLANRSKLIMKRAKAKQRSQLKMEFSSVASPSLSKLAFDGPKEIPVDDKSKKKVMQMIRNRISAQNSRDRKKKYVYQLEHIQNQLIEETSIIKQDKMNLIKQIKALEQAQEQLLCQNKLLKEGKAISCSNCVKGKIENQAHSQGLGNLKAEFEAFVSNAAGAQVPSSRVASIKQVITLATIISSVIISNMQGNLKGKFLINCFKISVLTFDLELNDPENVKSLFQKMIEEISKHS